MTHILYIGIGGFLGAVSRYMLSRYVNNLLPAFPFGTLVVNIIGSFVLGFIIYSVSAGKSISPEMRDFITIGMLGGFTTMSAFAYESFRMIELNQMMLFALNIALNVILCVAAVYAGKELALIISG
ncbi:MAG TPA: fluoride efflux transporter CrcB [Ignavibacteria bacterium]|nr:fluoride efflux transporter CrcB [Ignavibacteria bacterium]HRE09247.1 fluoride efflux transporter CrcB [Ignavibacteria bacterium]HRF66209.1 fluoride efflux transporter CrcB [Ignavibacteria bacterium]HRJ03845.1 fluoride efflux transporter CrcB [Ignavibacteria bacterium]HRJ85086.1 fluoride efflux transporter CrcB [Ignavibacteria bacterium]